MLRCALSLSALALCAVSFLCCNTNSYNADVCAQGFAMRVVDINYGAHAGYGQDKFPHVVLGAPQGGGLIEGSLDVLTLGVGGHIALEFAHHGIADGEGVDFIVFENPFYISSDDTNPYKELAEVSVSEDGAAWTTFPCQTQTFPYTGCAGWRPVKTTSTNGVSAFDAAQSGGDAFDLADVGISRARYVRVQDLSTTGTDTTAGFDLDAISVVHPACN